MSRIVLRSKGTGDSFPYQFDFSSYLTATDTVSSVTSVIATVYSGTDASPSSIISGAASVSSNIVTQVVSGGVNGVVYNIDCTVLTTAGYTLVLSAFLAVVTQTI